MLFAEMARMAERSRRSAPAPYQAADEGDVRGRLHALIALRRQRGAARATSRFQRRSPRRHELGRGPGWRPPECCGSSMRLRSPGGARGC